MIKDLRKTKSGRKAHHFDLEQIKEFIDETGGKVAVVAKRLGVCAVTLYRYIEIDHPELKEYIDEARRLDAQADVDSSEYVHKTLLDKLEAAPEAAFKAASYILKRRKAAKDRGWITDDKSDDSGTIDTDIADIASELQREATPGER